MLSFLIVEYAYSQESSNNSSELNFLSPNTLLSNLPIVFGDKYEAGLKKENVKYFYTKNKESLPTGTCLILVTPDSERTMCTFLGIAGILIALKGAGENIGWG